MAIAVEKTLQKIVKKLLQKFMIEVINRISPFSKKKLIALKKIKIKPAIIRLGKPSPSYTKVFRQCYYTIII